LVLGRVSNLPTVWTNCFAGWLLGGEANSQNLPFLFMGATFLYEAGMFLNDAFDLKFDQQHRPERPIPSGQVSLKTVWTSAAVLASAGVALLFCCGFLSGLLGLGLLAAILVYDFFHKRTSFAPVLMGICRWLLYLLAASTGLQGIDPWSIWTGFALGCYVLGLSCFARRESSQGVIGYWPLIPLVAPVVVAFLFNHRASQEDKLLLSLVFLLWTARSLRYALWGSKTNIGKAVSGLLAGIVLVDWLAVAHVGKQYGFYFIGMLFLALLLQRVVPAT
jgi:hypothetical protein